MTLTHILILLAFTLIGGIGLAAMQESFSLCWRAVFRDAKAPSLQTTHNKPTPTGLVIQSLHVVKG
jgi:hypothetical protein